MTTRFFYDADGELLIVPQQGRLVVRTELGVLEVAPGEICVIPRGVIFRVELINRLAREDLLLAQRPRRRCGSRWRRKPGGSESSARTRSGRVRPVVPSRRRHC